MNTEPKAVAKTDELSPSDILWRAALLLSILIWLVALMTGAVAWIREAMRPHVSDGMLVANLLLLPVTATLAPLWSVGIRTNFVMWYVICWVQIPLTTLSVEPYPIATGFVRVLMCVEIFFLVPWWNRRSSPDVRISWRHWTG